MGLGVLMLNLSRVSRNSGLEGASCCDDRTRRRDIQVGAFRMARSYARITHDLVRLITPLCDAHPRRSVSRKLQSRQEKFVTGPSMKFIDEYRDERVVRALAAEIQQRVSRPWVLMEIC